MVQAPPSTSQLLNARSFLFNDYSLARLLLSRGCRTARSFLFNSPGATTAQPFPGRALSRHTLSVLEAGPQAYGPLQGEGRCGGVTSNCHNQVLTALTYWVASRCAFFSKSNVRDGETMCGPIPPDPLPSKCVFVDSWQFQRTGCVANGVTLLQTFKSTKGGFSALQPCHRS